MTDSKNDDDGMSGAENFVQIFLIQCDIIAAHDLIKADVIGKSDPYVTVSALSTSYTTATIMKTLNPRWTDERAEMTFFKDPKTLKFEVWDWDRNTKDDPIGDCEFVLDEDFYAPETDPFHGRLKLQNVKKGELEIRIAARKLVPDELEKRFSTLQDAVVLNEAQIQGLDDELGDYGQRNAALQSEIDGVSTNIADLKAATAPRTEELQKLKEQGEPLDSEAKRKNAEVEALRERLSEEDAEWKRIKKQSEDVRVAEDKTNDEIERIRAKMDKKEAGHPMEVSTSLLPDSDTEKEPVRSSGCECCKCVVL